MENIELLKIQSMLNKLSDQISSMGQAKNVQTAPSRSPDVKDLATALAKAQGEMRTADLNRTNPYFKSKYADLMSVVNASRPALSKNGLSVIQNILANDDGASMLHTILLHSSGQYMESRMRINPPKNDIQTISSFTTYLKRMAYASLIGVVTGDDFDDDGEIAMVEARDIIAKGPSNQYNPKEQSYETITKEQLDELEYELAECPDLGQEILDGFHLQSLTDLPKSKYRASIERIRKIKLTRSGK